MNPLEVLWQFFILRSEQWKTPDELEVIQAKKLNQILLSASKTEFYKNLLSGVSLDNFHGLPLTSKEDIQKNPKSFLNPEIPIAACTKTSGSTGTPMSISLDNASVVHAIAMRALSTTEFGFGPLDKFAIFGVDRKPAPIYRSFLGTYQPLFFSIFDDPSKNYEYLQKSKANIIGWYPSTITSLARINAESENPIKLKAAFCGGEPLTNAARKFISDSFSCEVFDHYGLAEFSTVAFECPKHNLHVNTSLLVEIADQNGKPIQSGVGQVVITSLHNKAMPLLRYATGDFASFGTCSCGRGSKVLKSVHGRKDDLIVLPSGRVCSALNINRMDDLTYLLEFKIIQEKEDLFVFHYVPNGEDISASQKKEITDLIQKGCLGETVSVEFEKYISLKKDKSGKLSTVVSKIVPKENVEYKIWNSDDH
ncbi:AMP-binding protein [Candidatus Micrarchaeota archaeon]|nr:AMP-binding protein [Candidatus Micrarchaeota archaeon]MBU1681254.1 AMP-binding protein [Candidatus Micrarchaeota archaeon]